MKLNSKLTWGLAWTGLVVVLAVPSADLLTGSGSANTAVITSDSDPVETGSVHTGAVATTPPVAVVVPAAATDPVQTYLQDNKGLPDYISDGGKAPTVTPPAVKTSVPAVTASVPKAVASVVPATVATPVAPPVQVASIDPQQKVAPVPYPRFLRPHAEPEAEPPTAAAPAEAPLIVDEDATPAADVAPRRPVPPAGIAGDRPDDPELADYLTRRGMMDDTEVADGGRSSASVVYLDHDDSNYDADGFYLSDGPNGRPQRHYRRERRDDRGDWDFMLF